MIAFGNRVAKTVNGVTTQYLVEDDVNPTGLPQVVEETVNGVVTRSYNLRPRAHQPGPGHQRRVDAQLLRVRRRCSVRQLTNLAAT